VRQAILLLALTAGLAGCTSSAGLDSPPDSGLATMPGVVVPRFTVTHPAAADTAAGYVFVAPKQTDPDLPAGPAIVDDRGRVVWYQQVPVGEEATDFRAQTYRGRPVLTWWQGVSTLAGYGHGVDEIYDSHYRKIAQVQAADGYSADLHEFQLTPRGTALITVYDEVPADLSHVGGPKHSWALDCIVQEIDVATGKLLFEWHSIGHVPFSGSRQANQEPAWHATKRRPFDYFHINSVSEGPHGTLLISARNTSTIYLIARDGHIVWRIGSAKSDFGPPAAVMMRYQHDARLLPGNILTFFDNGGIPREEWLSSPTVLRLDPKTRTATVVKRFIDPSRIASPYEGDLQLLPDGGALVGWGGVSKVTEFAPSGKVRFELALDAGDTYRAYRLSWRGSPLGGPAIAVRGSTVSASWNGKLGVAAWRVLTGPDAADLGPEAVVSSTGLETAIPLRERPSAVAVEALGASGNVLGRSPVLLPSS
jgi:hypothetical protein